MRILLLRQIFENNFPGYTRLHPQRLVCMKFKGMPPTNTPDLTSASSRDNKHTRTIGQAYFDLCILDYLDSLREKYHRTII